MPSSALIIDLGETGMLRPPELAIHGHGAAVRHGLADLYFCITDARAVFLLRCGRVREATQSDNESSGREPTACHADLPRLGARAAWLGVLVLDGSFPLSGTRSHGCPCRELRPRILMVETTKNFDRGDPTDAPNWSRKRRVLIERQMSPRRIVIRDVR